MNNSLRNVFLALSSIRLAPHSLIFLLSSRNSVLYLDMDRWSEVYRGKPLENGIQRLIFFLYLMTFMREFRNLFYYRLGIVGKLFSWLCTPEPSLFLRTASIGPGFFIQHGFSTIVTAHSIGSNFWLNQQVTVGYRDSHGSPTIGDNVCIGPGAKVLGAIKVGNFVKIGANAVVIKDLPDGVTAVGVPARQILHKQ